MTLQSDFGFQTTVHIRPGQQQGIAVQVFNPSSQTQTVLGLAIDQSPACSIMHISVSDKNADKIGFEFTSPALHYTRPGAIPPHQGRILRVVWTSARNCLGPANTSGQGFDQLTLKVRVGLLTRTEVVPLFASFDLAGAK